MKNSFLSKINFRNKKTLIILILVFLLIITSVFVVIKFISNSSSSDQIDKVYVTAFPKLQYYVGEDADYSGLTIAISRRNGKIKYIEYNEENKNKFNFQGFDSSKPVEEQKIIVKYEEYSTVYYIVVKEIVKPTPVLINIKISVLPKTEYKLGEWLNTEGGIIQKEYSDGTTANTILINQYIIGWDEVVAGGVGTYTLTVKYKENGVIKKATYDIIVTE